VISAKIDIASSADASTPSAISFSRTAAILRRLPAKA
jgi:hypothetical protein